MRGFYKVWLLTQLGIMEYWSDGVLGQRKYRI
jgi:hypothetical protein